MSIVADNIKTAEQLEYLADSIDSMYAYVPTLTSSKQRASYLRIIARFEAAYEEAKVRLGL
jgi:hypothetical protein